MLIAEDGGIVSLAIDGYQRPLAILVGQAEALALLHSAGADLRRPSTLATWRHCLLVRRAVPQTLTPYSPCCTWLAPSCGARPPGHPTPLPAAVTF